MATLATAAVHRTKRTRPEDGGMLWHHELNAFECLGCFEFEEIHRAGDHVPDRLAELKELLIVDHTECWQFDDPEMARQARKYRKEKKRRENLAAQRTSWRGRDRRSGVQNAQDREATAIRERWIR
jgi:hypothetical protein